MGSITEPSPRTVVFVTVESPYGHSETFFLPELHWLKSNGYDIRVFPRRGRGKLMHSDAHGLEGSVWPGGTRSFGGRLSFVGTSLRLLPRLRPLIPLILRQSRGIGNVLRNCVVIPKALQLAHLLRSVDNAHIHAYWASTPATIAYLAAQLCGVEWSFSAHRGDIKSANLLAEKCRTAKFVRCISDHGRRWLCELAGTKPDKRIGVIHMGVMVPPDAGSRARDRSVVRIVCPANLLPVKGHRYLIEACRELMDLRVENFSVACYGAGPLRRNLAARIEACGVGRVIRLGGLADHAALLNWYRDGDIDILVLPSVTTDDGEYEGTPVALMEAMAHGIPVVTTATGSVGEIVDGNCGLLVPEKDSHALAIALRCLILDPGLRQGLGERGRQRIQDGFNLQDTAGAFGLALRGRLPGAVRPEEARTLETAKL